MLALITARRFALSLVALLTLLPAIATAQLNTPVLPQPSIDPIAAGTVDTMLRLSDGRILVGSATFEGFQRLGAATANACGRLLADGSFDPSFQCAAGAVVEFAVDSSSRVYVRSNFDVRRLLASGATDASFPTINTDFSITRMLIVDDQLYLAGVFTTVNGTARSRLARLGLDGVLDPTFTPGPDAAVFAMLAPGDGFLYLGGNFDNLAGGPRTKVGRLALPGGTLDAWTVALALSGGNPQVGALAVDATHLFMGGAFDSVQGQARGGLARVDRTPSATLDAGWTPQLLGFGSGGAGVSMLSVVGEQLYVGTGSSRVSLQNGSVFAFDRCLARVGRTTGAVDVNFDPFADAVSGQVCAAQAVIAGDGGGRLFVGGSIEKLSGGVLRFGLAALNADGSVDALTALPEALVLARIDALAIDPANGSRYLQGNFRRINGVPREGLIRMLNTGTIDSSFRPPARRYSAMALAGGKLYVADDDLRQLSRLDPLSGDPVAGFTPIGYALSVTSLQAAGPHVYLVGNYNLTGIAPPLGRFARMHVATDSLDNSFRFAADAGGGIVGVSADAASNSLFLYGSFNTLNGLGPARLARIDASTLAIDPAFNANVGGFVAGALIDDAGGVFISGGFTTVGAQTCRAPARVLLATGARDVAFACSANLGGNLLALSADAVYVAATSQIRRFARTAGGVTDPNWRVSDMPQQINGLQTFGRDLFVHGRYDHISGATRRSLAALPQVELFGRSGFE